MYRIDLNRDDCLFTKLREMVEQGHADAPFQVFRDGQHSVNGATLHGCALLSVAEEPRLRFARYQPHYRATIGPRMAALIEADKEQRAKAKEGRAT